MNLRRKRRVGKLGLVSGYQEQAHREHGSSEHQWVNDGSSRPVGSDTQWINQFCSVCRKTRQVRWTSKRMITRNR